MKILMYCVGKVICDWADFVCEWECCSDGKFRSYSFIGD